LKWHEPISKRDNKTQDEEDLSDDSFHCVLRTEHYSIELENKLPASLLESPVVIKHFGKRRGADSLSVRKLERKWKGREL
jgi:hypothetical protein